MCPATRFIAPIHEEEFPQLQYVFFLDLVGIVTDLFPVHRRIRADKPEICL